MACMPVSNMSTRNQAEVKLYHGHSFAAAAVLSEQRVSVSRL